MSHLHIGFTGTRQEVSSSQLIRLSTVMESFDVSHYDNVWFHHGDCVGADATAHEIARDLGWKIHSHPCNLGKYRANCECDVLDLIKPPLVRNAVIVDMCDILIACPKENLEQRRSGTWATIRYARNDNKIVLRIPR